MAETLPHKLMTLCIIHDTNHHRILLGMKKRGFGQGRWNGFGGKVAPDESIHDAALRELHEEVGIIPHELAERGFILFEFEDNPQKLEVHLFSAHSFDGIPTESEEMRPQWFDCDKIPYAEMWQDDKYWLPLFLKGKNLEGYFLFDKDDKVLKKELRERA